VVAELVAGAPAPSVDVSALSLGRFGTADLTSEGHVV